MISSSEAADFSGALVAVSPEPPAYTSDSEDEGNYQNLVVNAGFFSPASSSAFAATIDFFVWLQIACATTNSDSRRSQQLSPGHPRFSIGGPPWMGASWPNDRGPGPRTSKGTVCKGASGGRCTIAVWRPCSSRVFLSLEDLLQQSCTTERA